MIYFLFCVDVGCDYLIVEIKKGYDLRLYDWGGVGISLDCEISSREVLLCSCVILFLIY